MVWKRWKQSLIERPHAWCTPIGLLAVMGPSMNDQRCSDVSLRRMYRPIMLRSRHQASVRFSLSTKLGRVGTGVNARPSEAGGCSSDCASVVIDDLRFHALSAGKTKARPSMRDGPNVRHP